MSRQWLIPICLIPVASAHADVSSYECLSFPAEAGWETLNEFCDPEQWLEDGWLYQHVEACEGTEPPAGQQFDYRRWLADFAGEQRFFIEWRVQTDGDRSEIDGDAPAGLSAWGRAGVLYHFTIAKDVIRFVRDVTLPILWIDIELDAPHTYRLELYGEELYVWYIDGQIADGGVPEGAYPTTNCAINWRAKSWHLESTTRWDYIRYGTIPEPASGDFDSDGDRDLHDFYFFHECVSQGGPGVDAGPGCRWADMDADDDVDLCDFALFQASFTGSD